MEGMGGEDQESNVEGERRRRERRAVADGERSSAVS